MSYLASTIINNVRDLIPDQVYVGDTPQPDTDGNIRATTLYRWLDDGVRIMTGQLGWTLTDWTAAPAVTGQPIYSLNALFQVLDQAYANQLKCRLLSQPDADSIFPGRGTEAQAVTAYVFRATDHLDLGFLPVPNYDDPATTLNGGINASVTSIAVTSSAGFLPFGFVFIESELVQYQLISANTLLACTRGTGGTVAASHAGGAAVTHCSFWVKGSRSPSSITASTSLVEVPLGWVSLLNTYVLSQARQFQGEYQVSQALLMEFTQLVGEIRQTFGGREPVTARAMAETPATVGVPIRQSQMAP